MRRRRYRWKIKKDSFDGKGDRKQRMGWWKIRKTG